jgi:hypothetical protein
MHEPAWLLCHALSCKGDNHAQRPATQQSREAQAEAAAEGTRAEAVAVFHPAREREVSAAVVPKPRGRVITGWRHVVPPARKRKWRKPAAPLIPVAPVKPVTPEKAAA